jgi:hypothetical protein
MAKSIVRSETVTITATLTSLGFKATVQGCFAESARATDFSHEVNLQSTRLLEATCSCQDYGRRGPLCKHGGAVLMALLSGRIPTDVPTWPTMLAIDDIVPVPATPPTGWTSRPPPPSLLATVLKDLQAAEFEILELKGKLTLTEAALQAAQAVSCAPTEVPPQPIVQIVDAAGGHARRVDAINKAASFVFIVAFTYDLDDVTQAVIAAKSRVPGIDARVLLDREQALSGPTRNLRPRVLQLTSHSVPVRLYSRGRLHAKALLTDSAQVWGSLNWTVASLRNVERCVATSLPAAALAVEKQWFERLWTSARDFAGREPADDLLSPVRQGGVTQPG